MQSNSITKKILNVAVAPLTSTPDYAMNVVQALAAIDECASTGADIVVIPEMFSYIGPDKNLLDIVKRQEREKLLEVLSQRCRTLDVALIAGSIPEASPDSSRVYNSSYFIEANGRVTGKYRKNHLFRAEPIAGQPGYDETTYFLAGTEVFSIVYQGWSIAILICFDLRFSSIFQRLFETQQHDLIAIPAAFTEKTGSAHWLTLLQARAIEWQCFIAAANQVGNHFDKKESYGHSAIIDPWGTILVDTEKRQNCASAQLEKNRIKQVRSVIPMHSDSI